MAFGHEQDEMRRGRIWPYVGVVLTATGLGLAILAWLRRSPAQEPVTVEQLPDSTDSDAAAENRRSGPSV